MLAFWFANLLVKHYFSSFCNEICLFDFLFMISNFLLLVKLLKNNFRKVHSDLSSSEKKLFKNYSLSYLKWRWFSDKLLHKLVTGFQSENSSKPFNKTFRFFYFLFELYSSLTFLF